jgi:hypothetical protein
MKVLQKLAPDPDIELLNSSAHLGDLVAIKKKRRHRASIAPCRRGLKSRRRGGLDVNERA